MSRPTREEVLIQQVALCSDPCFRAVLDSAWLAADQPTAADLAAIPGEQAALVMRAVQLLAQHFQNEMTVRQYAARTQLRDMCEKAQNSSSALTWIQGCKSRAAWNNVREALDVLARVAVQVRGPGLAAPAPLRIDAAQPAEQAPQPVAVGARAAAVGACAASSVGQTATASTTQPLSDTAQWNTQRVRVFGAQHDCVPRETLLFIRAVMEAPGVDSRWRAGLPVGGWAAVIAMAQNQPTRDRSAVHQAPLTAPALLFLDMVCLLNEANQLHRAETLFERLAEEPLPTDQHQEIVRLDPRTLDWVHRDYSRWLRHLLVDLAVVAQLAELEVKRAARSAVDDMLVAQLKLRYTLGYAMAEHGDTAAGTPTQGILSVLAGDLSTAQTARATQSAAALTYGQAALDRSLLPLHRVHLATQHGVSQRTSDAARMRVFERGFFATRYANTEGLLLDPAAAAAAKEKASTQALLSRMAQSLGQEPGSMVEHFTSRAAQAIKKTGLFPDTTSKAMMATGRAPKNREQPRHSTDQRHKSHEDGRHTASGARISEAQKEDARKAMEKAGFFRRRRERQPGCWWCGEHHDGTSAWAKCPVFKSTGISTAAVNAVG